MIEPLLVPSSPYYNHYVVIGRYYKNKHCFLLTLKGGFTLYMFAQRYEKNGKSPKPMDILYKGGFFFICFLIPVWLIREV